MAFPKQLPAIVALVSLAAGTAVAGDVELPPHAPLPQPRPEAPRPQPRPEAAQPQTGQTENPATVASRVEKACRAELRTLGVAFVALPAIGGDGCVLPHPIEVTALSPRIRLTPSAVLNCDTARAAARLFQTEGMAAAGKHLGARISSIHHASAYVCRSIGGGGDLSEHASGNALDISGFDLSDDRHVTVQVHADANSAEARFLRDVRAAACGRFRTVLGPGTNADHADHFHFDMKKRRRPYCR